MKQVAQAVSGGRPRVVEVPPPGLGAGRVLVRTRFSLVSAGTDRLVIELAGKSLLGKARSRPDQVRKVLRRLRTEGLSRTLDAVRARLAEDLPLGYSAAGIVEAVGAGVTDLPVGRAVACAGAGYAVHAELLSVPRNLVVPVPRGLPLRHAAAVTLGAIALQGVRRADVRLGERVGVIGLGLLGLLTVQILRASGAHVFAVDLDPERVALARTMGAESAWSREEGDLGERARIFGGGHGLDAVVVTAASSGSDPLVLAAELSRLGGRIVVVGAVGLDVPRRLLYEKELDVRLARSTGPGRYDPAYEEKGLDYPYPWVPFTEGRNMEEFLALAGRGEVDLDPLLTHEYGIEEGESAYRLLLSDEGRSVIGLLFRYGAEPDEGEEVPPARVRVRREPRGREGTGLGWVGAGAFARGVLLPAFARRPGVRFTGVVTATGLSGWNTARREGFAWTTTRLEELLEDEDTDAVVIATRHRDHARQAAAALRAGKDVFLEKPLALDEEELAEVTARARESGRLLMVGFNRRFAPSYRALRRLFRERAGPLQAVYRVNAGPLPASHWTRDLEEGGGRILGEACHFVDLLIHLVGRRPVEVFADLLPEDGLSATLRFEDGSVGSLVYAVAGDPGLGKERLEVFADGVAAELCDFRRVRAAAGGRVRRLRAAPGKGHREEVRAFLDALRAGARSPVPLSQAVRSTRATFALLESAGRGLPLRLREE